MEETRVAIAPSMLGNRCRIARAGLSEFQCPVGIGKEEQALESPADIEDALSALAVLAKEVDDD